MQTRPRRIVPLRPPAAARLPRTTARADSETHAPAGDVRQLLQRAVRCGVRRERRAAPRAHHRAAARREGAGERDHRGHLRRRRALGCAGRGARGALARARARAALRRAAAGAGRAGAAGGSLRGTAARAGGAPATHRRRRRPPSATPSRAWSRDCAPSGWSWSLRVTTDDADDAAPGGTDPHRNRNRRPPRRRDPADGSGGAQSRRHCSPRPWSRCRRRSSSPSSRAIRPSAPAAARILPRARCRTPPRSWRSETQQAATPQLPAGEPALGPRDSSARYGAGTGSPRGGRCTACARDARGRRANRGRRRTRAGRSARGRRATRNAGGLPAATRRRRARGPAPLGAVCRQRRGELHRRAGDRCAERRGTDRARNASSRLTSRLHAARCSAATRGMRGNCWRAHARCCPDPRHCSNSSRR